MNTKYKIWIALSLLVVFGLGAAAGIFGERYYIHRRIRRPEPPRPHVPTIEMMAQELQLSPDQQARIHEIFSRNEERLKELRTQVHGRLRDVRDMLMKEIEEVLNPGQKEKFGAMIRKHMEMERRQFEQTQRKVRRDPGGPPPDRNKGEEK